MKKLCLMALALVLTLSLTACFGSGNDDPSDTTPTTTAPDTTPSASLPLPSVDPSNGTTGPESTDPGTIPGAANQDMYESTGDPMDGSRGMFPGMDIGA